MENQQENPIQETAAGQSQAILGMFFSTIALAISWKYDAFILFNVIGLIFSIGALRQAKREYGPVDLLKKLVLITILIIILSVAICFLTGGFSWMINKSY